ncbi:hypothetical protein DAKH74_034450 [Maudiozyma humilis]|uniref:Mannosyltransferase n=1 Tax=Maudiozyma humilis TaxID=51915 RepID=A0AAV5RZ01_MAUHU|nr:hypothetical protein DAKH74_034450 [Kazachstania humilis]
MRYARRLLRRLSDALEDVSALVPAALIALCFTAYLIMTAIRAQQAALVSHQDRDTVTDATFHQGCVDIAGYQASPDYYRQNATFLMLARNSELPDVLESLNSIEEHFNQWYHYPFTFLNDEEFSPEFRQAVAQVVSADVSFGTLSQDHWDLPHEGYSDSQAQEALDQQGDRGILYGSNAAYHKMCRFFSGAFYKHPLVRSYQWYWRLEPGVRFFCDLTYDPFFEMQLKGKRYGFTILISELYDTVPRLFRTTLRFVQEQHVPVGSLWRLFTYDYHMVSGIGSDLASFINHPHQILDEITTNITVQTLLDRGLANFSAGLRPLIKRARRKVPLSEDKFDDQEYNLCHFWSNFEIARVDLFDNDLYRRYFDYLDAAGGFWLERWGDAPVHSLGLALMLNLSDVHYFRDIGYKHSSLHHCPKNAPQQTDVFNQYYATDPKWDRHNPKYDKALDTGTGCRCKCPEKQGVEDRASYCQHVWHDNVKAIDPMEPRKALYKFSDIYAQAKEKFLIEHHRELHRGDDTAGD